MADERDAGMWGRPWLGGLRGWAPQSGGIGTPSPHRAGLGGLVPDQADAQRLYKPPTPTASGQWQPTEEEIREWGSAVEVSMDASPLALTSGQSVDILHASFPVPLPLFVTFVGEPINGFAWSAGIILFDVVSGVGRAQSTFSFPLPRPVTTPTSPQQRGFAAPAFQLAARTIQVSARLVGTPLTPEKCRASCAVAYLL